MAQENPLTHGQVLELARWNTPTIFNGWERITHHDSVCDAYNLEPTLDLMPQMGAMAGWAITLVIELSNRAHRQANPEALFQYLEYVASVPGPKIVVVQDLDKPRCFGSAWGEVFATIHRGFGCVGTITDGGLRDVDEMARVGFKAIGRQMCVGHGAGGLVRWNCPVEVFGRKVEPGQLIHADKHGFLVIPHGEERGLLEAARQMDSAECNTLIAAARDAAGKTPQQIIAGLREACGAFADCISPAATAATEHGGGEWTAGKKH